jgi:signal transduction histidine kinase
MASPLLDSLHPFSFTTNEQGHIVSVGRSLLRLYPEIGKKATFQDAFNIAEPIRLRRAKSPSSMIGEMLLLTAIDNERLQLRGHIVALSEHPKDYLFAITPLISRLEQISEMQLELRDFPIADPILDFLMFMRSQITARRAAEEARLDLEWESRTSKLLYSIILWTQEAITPQDIYDLVLKAVGDGLGWEIGHAYLSSTDDTETLKPPDLWFVAPGIDATQFQQASRRTQGDRTMGMIGKCMASRDTQWMANVHEEPEFLRKDYLSRWPKISGIMVPIIADNEVQAVLEFYTPGHIRNPCTTRRFFELLGVQVSNLISRHSARRREQEQLAALVNASKMATLGEIAAGVAHEINNPLYTLSLIGQVLKRLNERGSLTQEEVALQIERINSSVQRMARIVSELSDFSRESSTDPMIEHEVHRLISDTVDLCHARFRDNRVELIVDPVAPSWTTECHPAQISQVLLNLLNNAHDAISNLEERWIRIQTSDSGDTFTIRVTDSGKGIEPAIAKRIMSPFFTTKPPGRGTGLGLSISSNIMTDHGGSLSFDQASANTCFVLTIPKHQHKPKQDPASKQAAAS